MDEKRLKRVAKKYQKVQLSEQERGKPSFYDVANGLDTTVQ